MEEEELPAPGLVSQNLHTKCEEGECLPISDPKCEIGRMEGESKPSTRLVPQIHYQFFSKPSAAKTSILSNATNPWQQKRTVFTQEVIRRLLRTRKQLPCSKKQTILNEYMQVLKNSNYNSEFRREVLKSGINGYNKILDDDKNGAKPLYRSKEWKSSTRRLDKQNKKKTWLRSFKSCVFVPPTPGSELQKIMQAKEIQMRPGGRENYSIKIIETAGQTLENVLVKSDPFNGNKCLDAKCIPNNNVKNHIGCRRNNVGYKIPCKLCPAAYIGETGENMHTRAKSHLTKFYSKKKETRESSAFYKHIENKHGGFKKGDKFEDFFEIFIVKAYRKPLTRNIEEGTFIVNYEGEILNSKNEWNQPKIIRTTVVQGGAEMIGGEVHVFPRAGGSRTRPAAAGPQVNTRSQTTARLQGQ